MNNDDIETMTLAQTRAAAQELLDSTTGDLAGADAERFQALTQRAEQLREQQRQRVTASRDLVARLAAGELRSEGGSVNTHTADDVNPYGDRADDRPAGVRQRDDAMRVLERHVKAGSVHERGAETVEQLVSTGPAAARSWAARWALDTGSDDYLAAFAKRIADPQNGHLRWTAAEAEAWRRVSELQDQQRAMGIGTDSLGGFLTPFQLDPAVMITNAGSTNPLLAISRVVTTVSDVWHGVSSEGVTAEWLAEAAEVADASPTLAQPSIPAHKASAFVPFSFELAGDGLGFMEELGKLLADAYTQLTATAYTTGSGSGQPRGVITAVAAASGSLVASQTAETLAAEDVYRLQNALPPRFQPNARFVADLSILNTLRQFETTNGAVKFPSLQENPATLLGRPMHECSGMDGAINPAATENNYPLLYGDFGQFVITQRVGSTVELIQNLFGENRRPTGQRGAFLWARTGSDVTATNAFRMLSIPTTA